MEDDLPFSTADLFAYHKATGCPVMKAKAELLSMEAELRSRVLRAVLAQSDRWGRLHDPIEDDTAKCERIRAAAKTAEALVGHEIGRGRCHRIWFEQTRILATQGITWFSPAVMNPWTVFD